MDRNALLLDPPEDSTRSEEEALERILRSQVITAVYQPIVELDSGSVVGFEALARAPGCGRLEQPAVLFAAAARSGCVPRLDQACRTAAFAGALAAGMQSPWTLFVNIEPEAAGRTDTWLGPAAPAAAATRADPTPGASNVLGHQVVMELTERALTARPRALLELVDRIRALGWGIALDDVGADPRSLALLPLVRPDVIKLDLSLVQRQPSAQVARIVSAVNAEAERSGSAVLAEGIETEQHLAIALSLGATLGQGWLLGRPGPLPADLAPMVRPGLALLHRPGAGSQRSPYDTAAAIRAPRTARKSLLIEISKHLEQRALESGESTVVLSTFQEAQFFTPRTQERYETLAARSAFVGAVGAGMPAVPLPGVRGGDLLADDPLLGEWDIAVVGPHFAATLVARDLGDTGPDGERRFSFILSHDRELAVECAGALMSRVLPES